MSQNPSSQWEKLLSSFLCVTFTLCSSKTGRGILGPIFLKEFVNGIINETNLFLRRQCAENVCALFKNNNENKDLFAQDKENIQTINVGDFRLQATVIEILARIHLWKNIIETKLKRVFSELINPDKVIEEFKKIRSNEHFVKDIRNFINFINKGFGDKCMVFSFPSSSIKIGSYETNPEWVDFGQKGISLFITFPGGEGNEALDIEYVNIRGLRLGYKSNELSLQLVKNLEGLEQHYQWDNDQHKIAITMSSQDLLILKSKVAPIITEERKKQKDFVQDVNLSEKSSIVIQPKKDSPVTEKPKTPESEKKKKEEERQRKDEEERIIQQEKAEEERKQKEEEERLRLEEERKEIERKEQERREEQKREEERREQERIEEKRREEERREEEKRLQEKKKEEERKRIIEEEKREEERREKERKEEERKREEKRRKEEEKRKDEEKKRKEKEEKKKKEEEEEKKKKTKSRTSLKKKKEYQEDSEEEEEVPKRGKSLSLKPQTKKKNITEEGNTTLESTKELSLQSPSTPSESTLIDWNALFKSEKAKVNKPPSQKEESGIKKCLFPVETSTDTTFGDFLPPEESDNRPKKRKIEELNDETEIGDLLVSLQIAIQQKAQKKLKMAENIATKTAETIKEKIDKVKDERNRERTEIFNAFTKNYTDLKEKSASLSRKLQSSYQKFQLEISNQMKSHSEITNQISALKDSYQERLKSCGTKDEIECQKLEKFIKEEVIRMEREIKTLEMDNSAIAKLKELLAQEAE